MPLDTASSDEIKEEFNVIEKILANATTVDEYLEAMVRNQRLTAKLISDSGGVSGSGAISDIDKQNLPIGIAGYSIDSISSGDVGEAVFNISGSNIVATVSPSGPVGSNEMVVVTGDGNEVRSSPDGENALSRIVGSGSSSIDGAITSANYQVHETATLPDDGYSNLDTNDGSLTLQPGDEVPLASSGKLDDGGVALAVGASDAEDVRFYMKIDGEKSGGVTNSPLGAVNAPFSFVNELGSGIVADNSIEYWAKYSEDGTGPESLVSRIHIEEI